MRCWIALLALTSLARGDEKSTVRVKACEMISIEPVAFPRGSAEVPTRKQRALDELARQLRRPEISSVEVTGHASKAEERRDPELARARGRAVLEALVARGVDESHLTLAAATGKACVDFRNAVVNTPETVLSPGYRRHSFVVLVGCEQLD